MLEEQGKQLRGNTIYLGDGSGDQRVHVDDYGRDHTLLPVGRNPIRTAIFLQERANLEGVIDDRGEVFRFAQPCGPDNHVPAQRVVIADEAISGVAKCTCNSTL